MEKSAILLIVVALASVLSQVDASCIDRDVKEHNATESTVDKLSNFFMEVGCTLKSGAEKVKERVESGYNYLKSKIDDSANGNKTAKETTTENNGQNLNEKPGVEQMDDPNAGNEGKSLDEDRIIFKDSDYETTEVQTTTLVTINDRNALTAPEMCKEGEQKVDGKCREILDI